MRRWLPTGAALVPALLVLPLPGRAGDAPLEAAGRGQVRKVDPTGQLDFGLRLSLKNPADRPAEIRRAALLLASEGGWSWSLGDQVAGGRFYGGEAKLGPGANRSIGGLNYAWSAPASHALLALDVVQGGGEPRHQLVDMPLAREGYKPPGPSPARWPAYVGLQGPLEVFPLADGSNWIQVVGQIVNLTDRPLSLTRWRFHLKSAGKTVFDRDLLATLAVRGSREPLNEFMYGFAPPKGFERGELTIDAEVEIGGERHSIGRTVAAAAVEPVLLDPPVAGRWTWGNGPGELGMHAHYHWPEQRYAYDLTMPGPAGGRRQTFRGDPDRNESYFAWKRPIYAAAAGEVIEVVDDVPDNLGRRPNPENTPVRNSRIVVAHGDDRFTIYTHPARGSAAVKVGQKVRAGDLLARVGNAGHSTEPHLHFGLFAVDATGRARSLPARFGHLKSARGGATRGAPKGREDYEAGPPEGRKRSGG